MSLSGLQAASWFILVFVKNKFSGFRLFFSGFLEDSPHPERINKSFSSTAAAGKRKRSGVPAGSRPGPGP